MQHSKIAPRLPIFGACSSDVQTGNSSVQKGWKAREELWFFNGCVRRQLHCIIVHFLMRCRRIVGDELKFDKLSLELLNGKHLVHQLLQSVIIDLIV